MSDASEVWSRQEIESPCVRICVIHEEAGLCVGCRRTRHEIAGWSRMTPEARRKVMDEFDQRAGQFPKRRGGRAKRIDKNNS